MGSHSVTCHLTQVNLTLARQAGTPFALPGVMEGWVDHRWPVTYWNDLPTHRWSPV